MFEIFDKLFAKREENLQGKGRVTQKVTSQYSRSESDPDCNQIDEDPDSESFQKKNTLHFLTKERILF